MVVDFGRGNGFMAVNIGLFCGGLWVNGGVADFVCIPPLVADPHSLFSSSLSPTQAVVLPCSMWVSSLMICGFDGGGFWPW